MAKKINKIPVEKWLKNRGKQDIQSWLSAWLSAENIYYPRRVRLIDLYEMVMLDLHLKALTNNRKNKVLGESFLLLNEKDEPNQILNKIISKTWFVDFIRYSLDSIFFGHSLIELDFDETKKEITNVSLIERRNVIPEKQMVAINLYDLQGPQYTSEIYANYYVPVQYNEHLGLLLTATSSVLFKRYARASWSQFTEKFGKPIPIVNTYASPEDKQKILYELLEMGENGAYVLDGEAEKVSFANPLSGDNSKNFDTLIRLENEEMSKLILGQTMTTDNGSSLSQSEVHERVSNEIQESDMQFIANIVNDLLIPKMVALGYTADLLNHKFEFCYFYNQRKEEQNKIKEQETNILNTEFERVIKLAPYFKIDTNYIKEKFGVPVEIQQNTKKEVQNTSKKKVDTIKMYYKSKIKEVQNNIIDENYKEFVSLIDTLIKKIWNGAKIIFSKKLLDLTLKKLENGFLSVEYTPDEIVNKSLQNNLYNFSAAKTYQQLKDISKALTDVKGNKNTFEAFKLEVDKLNIQYNKNYLQTEYNLAQSTAQVISKWNELTENGKNMKVLITFNAVGDGNTTPLCKSLNKITRYADDDFFKKYIPPLHWECRSTLEKGKEITELPEKLPDVEPEFAYNAATEGVIFSEKHPYFENLPKKIKEKFKK